MVMVGPTKTLGDFSSQWDFNGYLWGLISYQRLGNVFETRQWHHLLGDGAPWQHLCIFSVKILDVPALLVWLFHCRGDKGFGASQEGGSGEVTSRAGPSYFGCYPLSTWIPGLPPLLPQNAMKMLFFPKVRGDSHSEHPHP